MNYLKDINTYVKSFDFDGVSEEILSESTVGIFFER
jgi:hypothetical protein